MKRFSKEYLVSLPGAVSDIAHFMRKQELLPSPTQTKFPPQSSKLPRFEKKQGKLSAEASAVANPPYVKVNSQDLTSTNKSSSSKIYCISDASLEKEITKSLEAIFL